jgi:DNA polymerase-3 subunit epsilon
MYAVVDVETTGLRTSWHDRIVEIAVVRLDESGRPRDEWCTLVNPDRDLGPQEIHGITAAEARRAPTFAELAGQIVDRLAGHTVVAHNLPFDAGFLAAEFAKLGYQIPVAAERGLCTMRLAGHFLPAAARSLQACMTAAGLPPHRAHSALHDARAAAGLLAYYLRSAGSPPPWASLTHEAWQVPWPDLPSSSVSPVTRRRAEEREPHFLTRLVDRLPRLRDSKADGYLDLLDQALLDRPRWQLNPGDVVVFTGSMEPPRELWEVGAVTHGLGVGDNVTRRTRLLVAADPDSMSGKAKKARQYGIPIVHPTAYQAMLDGLVSGATPPAW